MNTTVTISQHHKYYGKKGLEKHNTKVCKKCSGPLSVKAWSVCKKCSK